MKKKLFKDGSLTGLNKKRQALFIASTVGFIGFGFSLIFLMRFFAPDAVLGHLLSDFPALYIFASIVIGILTFFGMLYILFKPVFVLQNQKLICYSGLIGRHKYLLNDIVSIQISSDDETVTLDVKNYSGLNNRIEMKTVGELGKSIATFLKQNTSIKVLLHDI